MTLSAYIITLNPSGRSFWLLRPNGAAAGLTVSRETLWRGTSLKGGVTHRLLSSSFLGLPYRVLYMNHKKHLLRGLWVKTRKALPIGSMVVPFWDYLIGA